MQRTFGECPLKKVSPLCVYYFFLTTRQRTHTLAGGYILVHHTIDGWLFLLWVERGGLASLRCRYIAYVRVYMYVRIHTLQSSLIRIYVCMCLACVPSYNVLLYFILYRKGGAKEEREPERSKQKIRRG
jgi:hypothetical protein